MKNYRRRYFYIPRLRGEYKNKCFKMILKNDNLAIRSELPLNNYCPLAIEADGIVIGDINFHNMGNNAAQFGIEIFDENMRNKGYGTRVLTMFIEELFTNRGFERIIIDVKPDNFHAKHVYEKLGFKIKRETEEAVYYELTPDSFF